MAKKKTMMAGKTCSTTCGPTCIFMMLLSAAFGAGGLFLIVGGVIAQSNAMPWTTAAGWYFGGFLLWMLAKVCKMKACGKCQA